MGGTKLIRIKDDGHGIHCDDLNLALARHATSKISELGDLSASVLLDSVLRRSPALLRYLGKLTSSTRARGLGCSGWWCGNDTV